MYEDPTSTVDLGYEFLDGTPGQYLSHWPPYPPLTNDARVNYTIPAPPLPMSVQTYHFSPEQPPLSFRDDPSFSQTSALAPQPQEPSPPPPPPLSLQPREKSQSRSEPPCRRGTPSYDDDRGKWYCSVCDDAFRDRYECERHIRNVGKRAKCLACKKTLCARMDNRKRHYTKYCKRMDLGKNGGLRLEDAFREV